MHIQYYWLGVMLSSSVPCLIYMIYMYNLAYNIMLLWCIPTVPIFLCIAVVS